MRLTGRVLLAMGCTLACGLLGCIGEVADEDEETLDASSAIVADNTLSYNALAWNGISLNGISLNGISLNALDPTALSPGVFSALSDPGPTGELVRHLLRYTVGCGLSKSQSFSFAYTDASGGLRKEVYRGELSLAPAWATGPLSELGQRMVTACLAARVNYYEVPVVISVRSLTEPLKTLTSSRELSEYPNVEGAFWGNLFAAQPYIHACYNQATVDISRANLRDCAVGHLDGSTTVECGPIDIVGPCSSVCQNLNGAGQYYPSCIDRPGISTATIKTVITTDSTGPRR
jgi:hypothetical protein